jgi:hypothetical protein
MPAFVRPPALSLTLALVALGSLGAGCGKEIGDACLLGSDCSPNADRQCDVASQEGYCTIQGCDYSTCPEEAACIRFFTGNFSNRTCDPAGEDEQGGTNDCSFDELCALAGNCVPRSAEVRFCMRSCTSDDDCRSGYECRGIELMKEHGGEPVLAPGLSPTDSAVRFCATRPVATSTM